MRIIYFFPIFQESSTSVSYFVKERGKADAENAVRAARKFRIPEGNVIYFAVDLDATSAQITTYILPYFSSLHNNMDIIIRLAFMVHGMFVLKCAMPDMLKPAL